MGNGYLPPEQVLFGIVTSVIIGILMKAASAAETGRRETMIHVEESLQEIIGHSQADLAQALEIMESSIDFGDKARVTICTEALPTDDELDSIYLGMLIEGCHVSRPTAREIDGIPTTKFILRKGSPAWPLIIPILVPLFTIGLIAFGIAKLETITKAIMPILLVSGGLLIILAVTLRKPAERIIERAGTKYLAKTSSKKLLAVR